MGRFPLLMRYVVLDFLLPISCSGQEVRELLFINVGCRVRTFAATKDGERQEPKD